MGVNFFFESSTKKSGVNIHYAGIKNPAIVCHPHHSFIHHSFSESGQLTSQAVHNSRFTTNSSLQRSVQISKHLQTNYTKAPVQPESHPVRASRR